MCASVPLAAHRLRPWCDDDDDDHLNIIANKTARARWLGGRAKTARVIAEPRRTTTERSLLVGFWGPLVSRFVGVSRHGAIFVCVCVCGFVCMVPDVQQPEKQNGSICERVRMSGFRCPNNNPCVRVTGNRFRCMWPGRAGLGHSRARRRRSDWPGAYTRTGADCSVLQPGTTCARVQADPLAHIATRRHIRKPCIRLCVCVCCVIGIRKWY